MTSWVGCTRGWSRATQPWRNAPSWTSEHPLGTVASFSEKSSGRTTFLEGFRVWTVSQSSLRSPLIQSWQRQRVSFSCRRKWCRSTASPNKHPILLGKMSSTCRMSALRPRKNARWVTGVNNCRVETGFTHTAYHQSFVNC